MIIRVIVNPPWRLSQPTLNKGLCIAYSLHAHFWVGLLIQTYLGAILPYNSHKAHPCLLVEKGWVQVCSCETHDFPCLVSSRNWGKGGMWLAPGGWFPTVCSALWGYVCARFHLLFAKRTSTDEPHASCGVLWFPVFALPFEWLAFSLGLCSIYPDMDLETSVTSQAHFTFCFPPLTSHFSLFFLKLQ